jgi:hypothetical protein
MDDQLGSHTHLWKIPSPSSIGRNEYELARKLLEDVQYGGRLAKGAREGGG